MENEQINLFGMFEDPKIKKEIKELREKVIYYGKKYYEEDEAEISDYDYDNLMQRLRDLEKEHPDLVTPDSPTQNVGGKTKKEFAQVIHDVQMQSLQDVFNFDDVISFIDKVYEEFGENTQFVVETKIDGLSVSLEYENGILVRGSTRGDGYIGEDVTQNLKCIKNVPTKLKSKDTIEVRGEVYLSRDEFERINIDLEQNGKKTLSNPRNAAAGTLRQLNTELVRNRNLDIFVFNVQKGGNFTKHSESLDYLDSVGFTTVKHRMVCKSKQEVLDSINKIGSMRDNLPYDIDGAVVKVDDLSIRKSMGETVKVPKWAVAYKYPPERKKTKITDIVVQVGRTGQVTPMAVLEPVKVAGSKISKTTLHNFDFIEQKDIRIGDTVFIEKSGDVIPEVCEVLKDERDGTQVIYIAPKECPECHELLEKVGDEVALRCTNSECPAQAYRSIVHFASRDCMDISGMGEAIVESLIDIGKLNDISDIYSLKVEDILKLENRQIKSATNLIEAIEKSKNNTLDRLIFGLGIRHIGKKAAKILASKYEDIYELMNESSENLNKIQDIGKTMADSIVEFFKKEQTKYLIQRFAEAGVNLIGDKDAIKSDKLVDKVICVTGSFNDYTRNDIVKMIEENGGKSSSTVSKKTSYLIAGENAGSKLQKAEDLKVRVITIDDFLNIIL